MRTVSIITRVSTDLLLPHPASSSADVFSPVLFVGLSCFLSFISISVPSFDRDPDFPLLPCFLHLGYFPRHPFRLFSPSQTGCICTVVMWNVSFALWAVKISESALSGWRAMHCKQHMLASPLRKHCNETLMTITVRQRNWNTPLRVCVCMCVQCVDLYGVLMTLKTSFCLRTFSLSVLICVFTVEHTRLFAAQICMSQAEDTGMRHWSISNQKRWMIKARSQPALRDAAVLVHSRQTHHETEQTNLIDVSLLSAWRIREGVSQPDRQSSLQYISIGRIPRMILAVWCCDC